MSIQAAINQSLARFEPGQVFGYGDLPLYTQAPSGVIKAVSRQLKAHKIRKLAKGLFYRPKKGVLGELKPSDTELLKVLLYKGGQRRGYITGPSLYNRLGLTTQVPKTLVVATTGARQLKDFGTIRVKLVKARAPVVLETDIPLLELLDALKDLRKIPDATPSEVLSKLRSRLSELPAAEIDQLQTLAIHYYPAAARAVLGCVLETNGVADLDELKASLNPTTRYALSLDPANWPSSKDWYIQ